jgi:uncharacterized membrane protein
MSRARAASRVALALLFVAAGVNHFVHPAFYAAIVPPWLPAPGALVAISGAAEIAGGLGVLVPRLRRAAGWGLIALLIAVFPANIQMAIEPHRPPADRFPEWSLLARLPAQAFLMLWVYWAAAAAPQRSLRSTARKA